MHDPRVGRFFAVDPLTAKYPHYSPCSFAGNKVIQAVELEGLEEKYVYNVWFDGKGIEQRKFSHKETNNAMVHNQRVYRYFDNDGKIVNTETQNFPSDRGFFGKIGITASVAVNDDLSGLKQSKLFSEIWTGSQSAFYAASNYENSLGGKSGLYGNGGKLLLSTLVTVGTFGYSAYAAGSTSLISFTGFGRQAFLNGAANLSFQLYDKKSFSKVNVIDFTLSTVTSGPLFRFSWKCFRFKFVRWF